MRADLLAALVVAVLLVAGCTRGPGGPDATPSGPATGDGDGGPGAGVPEECARLSLSVTPQVFAVGRNVTLELGVENCGRRDLPLQDPGGCTHGSSLMVTVWGRLRTYHLHEDTPNGSALDTGLWGLSRGMCSFPVGHQPALLPPGASHVARLSWNGSTLEAEREEITSPQGWDGYRVTPRPGRLEPGGYDVTFDFGSPTGGEGWTARTRLHVVPTLDNPDLQVRPPEGMTLWLRSAPPLDPPPRPATLPPPSTSPTPAHALTPPEVVQEAAEAALRLRVGHFVPAYRLAGAEYVPMERFCQGPADLCDRWGWAGYHLLTYEVTLGPAETPPFRLELVVREDGLVVDEDVQGVPECVSVPAECVVEVAREGALTIAAQAGLGAGPDPWTAEYVWHRVYAWRALDEGLGVPPDAFGTFAWRVQNATADGRGGDVVVVDANDGRVVARDRWFQAAG